MHQDIIKIVDENLNEVANYEYDAYGNIVNINKVNQNEISKLNPYRYRSYYYDTETNYYYLNARYYNPEIVRFITADDIEYLDSENINGFNLYCYCYNNSIIYIDENGNSAVLVCFIVGAIIGAIIGFGVVAYLDYKEDNELFEGSKKWYDYLSGILLGYISGATIGAGIGYLAPQIVSFASTSFTIGGGITVSGGGTATISTGITITGAQALFGTTGLGIAVMFSLGADRYASKDKRANYTQNKEFERICDDYGLNKNQRQSVHYKISKKGFYE